MLGSREDAEDVLQEVFAAAFNAILADEREINVRPWLYRIARNRSLNHLRRASAIGVDSMDVHYAENGVSTAEKVMRRESFRQLIGDVRELPETQRTALLLREIDALSYEQISDAMETTVPAVKSLLVRARISLAEAAEARRLTCDEARLELGEVAEGLLKTSPAVRRHVRDCERCLAFRKQLRDNNVALAAMLPVGPILLLKKLVLSKLGTAGAGGAHVAGAGGAGAAAGASAIGGAGATGGFVTAGVSALATKAVAGLAVAAIVTAGTVEADHAVGHAHHHRHAAIVASTLGTSEASEPVVAHTHSQPVTISTNRLAGAPTNRVRDRRHVRKAKMALPASAPAAATDATQKGSKGPNIPVTPLQTTTSKPPAPVTQVTTDSTQLPSAQRPSAPAPPAEVTTTGTTTTTTTITTTATPPPATTTETTPPPAPATTPSAPPPPAPTTTTPTLTPAQEGASGSTQRAVEGKTPQSSTQSSGGKTPKGGDTLQSGAPSLGGKTPKDGTTPAPDETRAQ
jgi:RNA polymerase sigma factor (sigma-70 family)